MIDQNKLIMWIRHNDINNRSLIGFKLFFDKYRINNYKTLSQVIDDFDEKLLDAKIDRILFTLDDWERRDKIYIYVRMHIDYRKDFYKKKGQKINYKDGKYRIQTLGEYEIRFFPSGEIDNTYEKFSWI